MVEGTTGARLKSLSTLRSVTQICRSRALANTRDAPERETDHLHQNVGPSRRGAEHRRLICIAPSTHPATPDGLATGPVVDSVGYGTELARVTHRCPSSCANAFVALTCGRSWSTPRTGRCARHGGQRPRRQESRAAGRRQRSADRTARLLRAAALERVVGRVTSVDDMGEWTPAPTPHRHTAAVLRLEPGQLAMVAVHTWDMHGAVRTVFTAAWGPASRAPTRRRSTRRTFPVATPWRSSRAWWH